MPDAAFDTHAEIRKLEEAGCPEHQAEAIVGLVSQAPLNMQMVKDLERVKFQVEMNMATKSDIVHLDGRITAVQGEMAALRSEAKADSKHLDGRITAVRDEMRADMYRALWIQGCVLAGLILSLAGVMIGIAMSVLPG